MWKTVIFFILIFHSHLFSRDFVLFTQPKTGTHLLIPILTELTDKEVYWAPEFRDNRNITDKEKDHLQADLYFYALFEKPWTKEIMDLVWAQNQSKRTFLHLHAPYTTRMENYLIAKKCITFFIKRDPRDQLVSLLNHFKYVEPNRFDMQPFYAFETDSERLIYLIKNKLREQTIHFMNWLNSPICILVEFEKLMGSHGGAATEKEAIAQLRIITNGLEKGISNMKLKELYQKHFGHGWSFFKGKVGTWKEYFNEEHKVAIKQEIGDLLIELGYERDMEW